MVSVLSGHGVVRTTQEAWGNFSEPLKEESYEFRLQGQTLAALSQAMTLGKYRPLKPVKCR